MNHCSCLVSDSVGLYRHLMMRARLHVRAVNRSLFDSKWRVIPLMMTVSWMKSFFLLMSVNSGTVFNLSRIAWVHNVHIHEYTSTHAFTYLIPFSACLFVCTSNATMENFDTSLGFGRHFGVRWLTTIGRGFGLDLQFSWILWFHVPPPPSHNGSPR